MSDIGYLIGSGLLGAIGGAAQGRIDDANTYNKRLDEEEKEDRVHKRQVEIAELQNRLAEQRQVAIENRKREEETRKGGLVKDAYSAAMVDGKVDPKQMRHNAIMSGNMHGADAASALVNEEESGMLHKADADYKTAYANRLNAEADVYKSGFTKSGKQIGGGNSLGREKFDSAEWAKAAGQYKDDFKIKNQFGEEVADTNGKALFNKFMSAARQRGLDPYEASNEAMDMVLGARKQANAIIKSGKAETFDDAMGMIISNIGKSSEPPKQDNGKGKQGDNQPEKTKQQAKQEPKREKIPAEPEDNNADAAAVKWATNVMPRFNISTSDGALGSGISSFLKNLGIAVNVNDKDSVFNAIKEIDSYIPRLKGKQLEQAQDIRKQLMAIK